VPVIKVMVWTLHLSLQPAAAILPLEPAAQHPLDHRDASESSAAVPAVSPRTPSAAEMDPLSALLSAEAADPLRGGSEADEPLLPAERKRACREDGAAALCEDAALAEEWNAKKQSILNRFAVAGNITVNAQSFDVVGRAKRGCVARQCSPLAPLTLEPVSLGWSSWRIRTRRALAPLAATSRADLFRHPLSGE